MSTQRYRSWLLGTAVSACLLIGFISWAYLDSNSLNQWVREDGPIENATALFFALSALAFVVVAGRSRFLRAKERGPRYLMIVMWALLMIIFAGEEISWGQRMFDLETPEGLASINKQVEINIHNIYFADRFLGGVHRYVSIMMLATGLGIPLFAASHYGKRVIQWWAFPVCPKEYWLMFVGGYLYGKLMKTVTLHFNDAAEVREFILALGMLMFAVHGACKADALFLADSLQEPSDES